MFGADPPRQGVPVAGWGFFRGTRAVQRHRHRGAVDPPPRLNLEPVGYLLLGESSGYAFEENLVGWQDTSGRRAREGKAASRRPPDWQVCGVQHGLPGSRESGSGDLGAIGMREKSIG